MRYRRDEEYNNYFLPSCKKQIKIIKKHSIKAIFSDHLYNEEPSLAKSP